MQVKILKEPYYDNIMLHPVGDIIVVSDDFDLGNQQNFGRVNADGSISIPVPKAVAAKPGVKQDYEWKDMPKEDHEKEVPIYPPGVNVVKGMTTVGAPVPLSKVATDPRTGEKVTV